MLKLKAVIENGGFSINTNGETPADGFMVAVPDFEVKIPLQILSPAVFGAILAQMAEFVGDRFIGGWIHNDTLFMDISENVQDQNEAIKIGRKNGQLAIWHITDKKEIDLSSLPIVE